MEKKLIIGGGLAELPRDQRDFSRTQVFGAVRADKLPEDDFMVAPPMGVKDQGDTDYCTAFASCAASEDQEGVLLEPAFSFFVGKVLIQNSPDTWGCDLRSMCKGHQKYGGLDMQYSPFQHYQRDPEREEILDPKTWDEDHKMLAFEHRKNSFFDVDGPHDLFDNMRSALYLHRAKMQSVITGCKFRSSWLELKDGVIPKDGYESFGTPHAFIIKGQKKINGEIHLIAQLSNSEDVGDKGYFYFPRDVVNKEFGFGAFMFEDMPKEEAKNHMYYGTSKTEGFLSRWLKIFGIIIRDFFVTPKRV